jgi:hypothetical protein
MQTLQQHTDARDRSQQQSFQQEQRDQQQQQQQLLSVQKQALSWQELHRAAQIAAWSGLCYVMPDELQARIQQQHAQLTLVAHGRNAFTGWWVCCCCGVHAACLTCATLISAAAAAAVPG